MTRWALVLCFSVMAFWARGQFTTSCIDSFKISPNYPCSNTEFRPVCGCDGKTYRNLCEAQLRYGVQTYTDGSCSGYEFDIIPTYSRDFITFTLVQSEPRFSRLFIVDMYGRLWDMLEITASPWNAFSIDVAHFQFGSYVFFLYDSVGNVRMKRFVKVP